MLTINNMHVKNYKLVKCLLLLIIFPFWSCQKLVDVGPPVDSFASSEIFKTKSTTESAVVGMYAKATGVGGSGSNLSSILWLQNALLSDELDFNGSTFDQYRNNNLLSNEPNIQTAWTTLYTIIYNSNAIIEGVKGGNYDKSFKDQYTGEALFIRSLSYFYLVNTFGDVPLITATNISDSKLAPRVAIATVYSQIVKDLELAVTLLPETYPSGTTRTRANKWAATALLARLYLYTQQYNLAETASSQVIALSSIYTLPANLNTVFTKTSTETIFAYDLGSIGFTSVGSSTNPGSLTIPPYFFRSGLITSFEPNDLRRTNWIGTLGTYTYPFKLKSANVAGNEVDMVIRLAELYLIRAEARANLNNLTGAQADVNTIRSRAGLGIINLTTQANALAAIAQERRIEFFAECGHRWFDLKRTGQVGTAVGVAKPFVTWKPTYALYPIPFNELLNNLNLVQNPGYN